MHRSDNMASD